MSEREAMHQSSDDETDPASQEDSPDEKREVQNGGGWGEAIFKTLIDIAGAVISR